MAIIHSTLVNSGDYAVLERIRVEEGEDSFDRGGMDILFFGTEKELRAAFPKGSTTNFPNSSGSPVQTARMVCAGVKITRNRFGFLWARVEWVGLLLLEANSATPDLAFANTAGVTAVVRGITTLGSTKELQLPFTPDGGGTIAAVAPYNGSGGLARDRQRLMFPDIGRDYSMLLIIPRRAPIGMPKIASDVSRPAGLPNDFNDAQAGAAIGLSQANWFSGISAKGGWLCRDFQAASLLILGDSLLCRASAKFQWIDRFSI